MTRVLALLQMTFETKGGLVHENLLEVMVPNKIDWAWWARSARCPSAHGRAGDCRPRAHRFGFNPAAIPKETFEQHHFGTAFNSDVHLAADRWFSESDFAQVGKGKNLFFTMNAGRMHLLLQNPNYQALWSELGLNIDNMFAVLWKFLVKPRCAALAAKRAGGNVVTLSAMLVCDAAPEPKHF